MIGLGSKVAKIAKVAKKVGDTKKSAIRKVFDELPEDVKSEMPSQPDDLSVYGYHGTAKERSVDEPFFDINFARKQDQFMGEGFYFTMDPVIAGEYANIRGFKDFDLEGSDGKGGSLLRKRDTGVLTSTSKLLEGLDIDDNPLAVNQSVSRFDLSGLEKPYVVKNNKDRLYVKDNIAKIKKQGYDSVLFAEFGDRSKQIMVFPEHMDKIDTSKMASTKRASSNFAEPLEIGINKDLEDGKFLKGYNAETVSLLDSLVKNATAGSSTKNKLINKSIEDGTKIGIRLNLASKIDGAPKGVDKLQTLHKNNFNGKALSYVPYATVENVIFNVSQKGRAGIASKKYAPDVPEAQNKFPAMSVDGIYKPNRNVLNEVDGYEVEIGFNPMNLHLFVDMKTGQAVKGADVATVIGDRAYAKNVTYLKKADAPDPIKASDKTELPSQVRYKFSHGGIVHAASTQESSMPMNPILKHHYENIATGNAVQNEDGSLSTVKSAIVEIDGKETLIPTVWNGEILESERLNEAINNAINSGIKWPSIDTKNVKAVERLNNLDKILHTDMTPISQKEAQEVLLKEFSKKRNSVKGALNFGYGTTTSDSILQLNDVKDPNSDTIEEPKSKKLFDKLKDSPLKYIKDLNLQGENKRIELGHTINYSKGGTAMMERQMEMFEDGGLKDQGGTVDPMSGNDVPVGSSQKEVRDDIPAQLSEGEFVFPADVVRFIGLEKLMTIRQQAKMGLQEMEEMGQMGNSEEATMPDDMPFGMSDLIVMSPEGQQVEMAEGGVIKAATGVNVTPSTRSSSTGVTRTNNMAPTSSNFSTPTTRPLVTGTSNTRPRPNIPTFSGSMGQAAITLTQYQNSSGATLMVPHMGGKPVYPVPEGYYKVNADGTPVNPADVTAPGTGQPTTPQPVKRIEVPDGPDRDIIGMVPGSVGSASSMISASSHMADLMLGKREPNFLEKMFIGSDLQKNMTKKQLEREGLKSTNDDKRNLLALSLYNATKAAKRFGINPTSKEGIKNLEDIEGLKTLYVGAETKLANQQMSTNQFFIPTESDSTKAKVTSDDTSGVPSSVGFIPDNYTPSLLPDDQSPVTVETPELSQEQINYNRSVVAANAKFNEPKFAQDPSEIPTLSVPDPTSIETQKMLDAYDNITDYNPYTSDPKVEPPKVNILTSDGIKTVPQLSLNELANNSVEQPGFGFDANTSFSSPQTSIDAYNVANNPAYEDTTTNKGYVASLFDRELQAKKARNTQLQIDSIAAQKSLEETGFVSEEAKVAEQTRAKAAEDFSKAEAIRAANELAAAEKQLADLAAKDKAAKDKAAKDKEFNDMESATYSDSSPATGGFTGYSGDYGGPDNDPSGTGGTGGYGMFNQGGLAGKKPKKKMKTYKKGGLVTPKK